MSITGTRLRTSRIARLTTDARAEQENPAGSPSPAITPFWLLWSTGIIAFVLCVVAFALWGINGTSTLFDMIVALCI
jgi:hypothetical protein